MFAPPEEAALGLRRAMVEVLKQLNRDEMEEPNVPGLEIDELRSLLARGAIPLISQGDTVRALQVLIGNGYARELTDARYAWTRGRTVQNRFTITTAGKSFLLRSITRVGRV